MAEIATNVLHNVGNVLNSVNVSASLVTDSIKASRAAGLGKVVALLQQHEADLGTFVSTDQRGKHLPVYLAQLSEHLKLDQHTTLQELEVLRKNIDHIKEIVAMQQSYSKLVGVPETASRRQSRRRRIAYERRRAYPSRCELCSVTLRIRRQLSLTNTRCCRF